MSNAKNLADLSVSVTTDGSVTANALTYTGALTGSTGVLNIGSGQIYKDSSGNVGIGTSSPGVKLDVAGVIRSNTGIKSITSSGGQPEFVLQQTGVAAWTIYNPPSGTDLRFYNGSDRMTLDSSGNLGIGTSSPGTKLEINGRITAKSSADPNLAFVLNNTASGGREWQLIGSSTGGMDNGSTFNIRDNTASANRVTLDASGNLGLGATPNGWGSTYKALHFAGQGVSVWGSTTASLAGFNSNGYNNGTSWIYNNSASAGLYQINGNSHQWYNAPSGTAGNGISWTQAMTLDASGNLGIGVTSPSVRLHVSGTGLRLASSATNTGTYVQFYELTTPSWEIGNGNGANGYLYFKDTYNNAERVRITAAGNLGIGTTSPTSRLHLSSNLFDFRYAYNIDYRGVCDGVTGGYLLIIPAYPGSGTVDGKKFYGSIIADRGSTGEGNSTNIAHIHASTAYQSGTFLVQVSQNNQYFASVHIVTYSGTQYYALRFTSTGGGPSGGIYISGAHRGLDANCLTMKLDSEVTNVSAFGTRTVLFP